MATFIDERPEEENEYENLEQEIEDVNPEEVIEEPEQANQNEPSEEDALPEKYRGKSDIELAKMHMEAEKLLGRQSSEVGELRSIVDDFVKSQLETQKAAPQQDEEEPLDWFSDPDKALEQALAKHPKIKEAESVSQQMRKAQALADLQNQHPDYQQVLGDDAFKKWVSNSKIRLQLFHQADAQYDTEAASELLSLWKERQQYTNQAVSNERTARKEQVRAASTGSISGSGEAPSKKIYRRADLIKLMQTDPDRYMSMSEEIQRAYAEKRVR
jgi:hypothetical protein